MVQYDVQCSEPLAGAQAILKMHHGLADAQTGAASSSPFSVDRRAVDKDSHQPQERQASMGSALASSRKQAGTLAHCTAFQRHDGWLNPG